jgi:hypothetical protein
MSDATLREQLRDALLAEGVTGPDTVDGIVAVALHVFEPTALAAEVDRFHTLCGASTRLPIGPMGFTGPCVLRVGHDGPVHQDADGVSWTGPQPATTESMCPPDLRDQLAKALRGKYDSEDHRPSYRAADAAMPVVQAALTEQTKRAEQAEELLRIAHDTSNRSEAERARAARQRDEAIAALTRYAAEAHGRKWAHSEDNQVAFDALHRLGDEILASRDRLIAAFKQLKESA